MTTLATTLGLRAATSPLQPAPPSLTGYYIMFHFLWAYGVLSSRTWKQVYGLDNQASPRQDLAKHGAAAVKSGKITSAQLDQLHRIEACSANSVENFTLFVAAVLWAHVSGVPTESSNAAALTYTVARLVYSVSYIFTKSNRWALVRGVVWWVGNITCLRLLWLGSKKLNSAV